MTIASNCSICIPSSRIALAFLTCEPNPLVAPIHPKAMPVLLTPEEEETWLACDFDAAITMAVPFPSQLMTVDQSLVQ